MPRTMVEEPQTVVAGDAMHHVAPAVLAFANTHHWCTVEVYEYQDAQRFVRPGFTYGPIAEVVASPYLREYATASAFDGHRRNVAILFLEHSGGSIDGPYTSLGLRPGLNCVYLERQAGNWMGRIAPPKGNDCDPADATVAATPALPTIADVVAGAVPPTTRFVQRADQATMIGVQCGTAWCIIGASSLADVPTPVHTTAGLPPGFEPQVKGWFDEQELGLPGAAGVPPIQPARGGTPTSPGAPIFASVIPVPGLADSTLGQFADHFVKVGAVFMPDSVEKYATRFGFLSGWSTIELSGQRGDARWYARITDSKHGVHYRFVSRHPATIGAVPGTARWAWNDNDEWVWVACDIGCCLIEPGNDINI
ncbi:MAG: hypothetical protein ACHQWU_01695 [Gemmatimonadales bacterium]